MAMVYTTGMGMSSMLTLGRIFVVSSVAAQGIFDFIDERSHDEK
jgi:hypothetical protein